MDLPIQGASIQINLTPELPMIIADSFQIQQVLLNLIRIAAEAMQDDQENKTIIIRTTRLESDHVQISIADRGHGMSEEYKQKIFTPFFSTKASGMGIGLAVCRPIVESHRSELKFENNPTGGPTFNLALHVESGV